MWLKRLAAEIPGRASAIFVIDTLTDPKMRTNVEQYVIKWYRSNLLSRLYTSFKGGAGILLPDAVFIFNYRRERW